MTESTPPDTPPASLRPRRRHDLDALWGLAMLLGIGLHVALAFFPTVWLVQDSTSSSDGTPIGTMLNGKRTRPKGPATSTANPQGR